MRPVRLGSTRSSDNRTPPTDVTFPLLGFIRENDERLFPRPDTFQLFTIPAKLRRIFIEGSGAPVLQL